MARAIGFRIVAAGKGTKYLPEYHASTPDTVWELYGIDAAQSPDALVQDLVPDVQMRLAYRRYRPSPRSASAPPSWPR